MKCKICGVSAHGCHFGAVTCRACAVFFKRAILAKRFRKACKNGGECTDFTLTPSCKTCRLKQCWKVGMNADNIQSKNPEISPDSIAISIPSPILLSKIKKRNFIDLNFLVSEAFQILKSGSPTPWNPEMNQLEKMAIGTLKPPVLSKKLDYLGRNNVMKIWKFDFLSAAKWLTHLDEFMEIPLGTQMQLLQTVWHVYSRINQLNRTAELWKNKRDNKVFQLCNGFCIDLNSTVFDVSWIANCTFMEMKCLLYGKDCDTLMEECVNSISKLSLTEVELTFMIAQFAFQYAASRFPGTTISDICDRFQELLANDLHKYYTSDRFKDKNYAGRLAQMMRINQGIQKSIRMLRDKLQIANIFDIFIIDFSHPEMFIDTGYTA